MGVVPTRGRRALWGTETVEGAAVLPTKRYKNLYVELAPDVPTELVEGAGYKHPTDAVVMKEMTLGNYRVPHWGVNEFLLLISSMLGAGNPVTPGGATTTRRWTFADAQSDPNTVKTYTVALGSSAHAARTTAVRANGLELTMRPRGLSEITGSLMGKLTASGLACQNVYLDGATGGTFTLTYDGETTAALDYDISAEDLQTALAGLSSIGPGNATVLGGTAGQPFQITLGGSLRTSTHTAITADGALLTGDSPSISVGNCVDAITETVIADAKIAPTSIDVYVGASVAGLALMSRQPLEASLRLGEKAQAHFELGSADPGYGLMTELPGDKTISLVCHADNTLDSYLQSLRSGTTTYVRIVGRGALIEAGFPYQVQMTAACKVLSLPTQDRDGAWCGTIELGCIYDSGLGTDLEIVIDTAVTAL